jgi:hypothetical protein
MSVARQGGKKERKIMNWQSRLEKTVIALNLIGLALGFGALGILILVKGEHGGHSWISGVLGIFVGSLFLLFAFYFCKHNWGRRLGKVSLREAMDYFLPSSAAGKRQLTVGKDGGRRNQVSIATTCFSSTDSDTYNGNSFL